MTKRRKTSKSSDGRYVGIPHIMAISPAFRSLSGAALKVYIELRDRYNGSNNGELHLACDAAAKILHLGKTTVMRALAELEAKGFIRCTNTWRDPDGGVHRGSWARRQAATWRLTDRPETRQGGALMPTNEWQKANSLTPETEPNHPRDGTKSLPKRNHDEPDGSTSGVMEA